MNTILETFTPIMQKKFVLLLNHLLSTEPIAMERLHRHQGKTILLRPHAFPALLEMFMPELPTFAMAITPAGLLDWRDDKLSNPDLEVTLDASDLMALASTWMDKAQPPLRLIGDAQLATDINWLVENIHWDVSVNLEPAFGPQMAMQIASWGEWLKAGLNGALQRLQALMSRRSA